MKHYVISEPTNAATYSNLILLNKHYSAIESRQWSKFKKRFIKRFLKRHGKLICHYCKRDDLTENGPDNIATIDHILPRSLGGKDVDKNALICCSSCNRKKASSSKEEFEASKYLTRKKKK